MDKRLFERAVIVLSLVLAIAAFIMAVIPKELPYIQVNIPETPIVETVEPEEVTITIENYHAYLFYYTGYETKGDTYIASINFEGARPNFLFVNVVVICTWGPVLNLNRYELKLTASGQGKTMYYEDQGIEYLLFVADITGTVLIL